ncbi:MAG TPA: hypothetical protein VGM20_12065 [Gemmatimonadales bacterium]|jgi:hypothetical protein
MQSIRSGALHGLRILGASALAVAASVATLSAQGRASRDGRNGVPEARDSMAASLTDPRVGLHSGFDDAGTAQKNMRLVGHHAKPDVFDHAGGLTYANSDLAFKGNYVIQGNFSGFQIWDVSNPSEPFIKTAYYCPTSQGDPSVWGNLLFISSESTGDRKDCKAGGVQSGADRMIGVRIFDISDIAHPKVVANVQNCRGSHTHTLVQDPNDKNNLYVYISGTSGVRDSNEMAGCIDRGDSTNSARFRIEIIKVPLAHPEDAKVVAGARIFEGLRSNGPAHGNPPGDTAAARGRGGRGGGRGAPTDRINLAQLPPAMVTPVIDSIEKARGGTGAPTAADSQAAMQAIVTRFTAGAAGRGGRGGAPRDPNAGPNQCHDITVYPSAGLAGGACAGLGLLLDIKNPLNPTRLDFVGDTNFSFWHSATFSNDAKKVVFTDEWGGGTGARCRAIDPLNWGSDAVFTINNGKLTRHAYFKMPAAQTEAENCVAHNGSLLPVPGRDIMVQGWYQGGVDVFDFSNPDHVQEIAYFDRGPIPNHPEKADSQSTGIVIGGFWCGYWYNGHIYASEIARGIDIFDLTPSEFLSQNEIDAAKLIHMDQFNPQDQPKLVWPAAFPVVKSYLDQLDRDNGLPQARREALWKEIDAAEKAHGAARASELNKIATQLDGDAKSATDGQRVQWMAQAARDLARASAGGAKDAKSGI